MIANVRRLAERREAHASRSCGHPEAKRQSRATVRSRAAGVTLDGGESEGNRALPADAVTFRLRMLVHLTSCG